MRLCGLGAPSEAKGAAADDAAKPPPLPNAEWLDEVDIPPNGFDGVAAGGGVVAANAADDDGAFANDDDAPNGDEVTPNDGAVDAPNGADDEEPLAGVVAAEFPPKAPAVGSLDALPNALEAAGGGVAVDLGNDPKADTPVDGLVKAPPPAPKAVVAVGGGPEVVVAAADPVSFGTPKEDIVTCDFNCFVFKPTWSRRTQGCGHLHSNFKKKKKNTMGCIRTSALSDLQN